jgi:hypothetical protein
LSAPSIHELNVAVSGMPVIGVALMSPLLLFLAVLVKLSARRIHAQDLA